MKQSFGYGLDSAAQTFAYEKGHGSEHGMSKYCWDTRLVELLTINFTDSTLIYQSMWISFKNDQHWTTTVETLIHTGKPDESTGEVG